jgi:hypothetical protein
MIIIAYLVTRVASAPDLANTDDFSATVSGGKMHRGPAIHRHTKTNVVHIHTLGFAFIPVS